MSINIYPTSPETNYIMGVRLGDGFACEVKGKAIVGLKVKDKDFAEEFRKCLKKIVPNDKVYFQKDQGYWRVVTHSRDLFILLKSKNVDDYMSHILHEARFIRGVADSEGCVYFGNKKYNYIRVKISNTNLALLHFIQEMLRQDFGIVSRINPATITPKTKNQLYDLDIKKTSDVAKFSREIGFTIKRKQRRLNKVFTTEKRMLRQVILFEKAKKLHKDGYGSRRISKKLKVPRSTIIGWLTGRYRPVLMGD